MGGFKGFWRHIENGALYAIESTAFGEVLGGVGPLDPNTLRNPDEYTYDQKINLWLKRVIAENKLRRINPGNTGVSPA